MSRSDMTSSDAILTMRSPAGDTVSDAGGSFLPLAFACQFTQNLHHRMSY